MNKCKCSLFTPSMLFGLVKLLYKLPSVSVEEDQFFVQLTLCYEFMYLSLYLIKFFC